MCNVGIGLTSLGLHQTTQHWDTMLVQRVILLPPPRGKVGMGGNLRGRGACVPISWGLIEYQSMCAAAVRTLPRPDNGTLLYGRAVRGGW